MTEKCIKNNSLTKIMNIIDDNKQKITNNEYMEVMNALKKIYEYKDTKVKMFMCEGCNMEYCNEECVYTGYLVTDD